VNAVGSAALPQIVERRQTHGPTGTRSGHHGHIAEVRGHHGPGGGPLALVFIVGALYGFTALGDSPVLSTALTEAVSAPYLGAALALRSFLGFGAGAVGGYVVMRLDPAVVA